MMLIQKPQSALSSSMSATYSHRRQSSTPVVVQPTRIPGLLSLSKPPRSTPPRHQQRQNSKKQAPTTSATLPTVVRAQTQSLTPTAQIYTAPVTPSPRSRGRPQEKHLKDKNMRNEKSASKSPPCNSDSAKHNGRQPSPPISSTMTKSQQKPLQAEVPVDFTNPFDPLVIQSTLTPSPRKQPYQSQSKAIPVPVSSIQRNSTLARSDPLPTLLNHQPRHLQQPLSLFSRRALMSHEFPICDDMSEIADDDDDPSTPVARRLYEGAPLQAPPSTSILKFSSPSPQAKKNGDRFQNKRHRRTPSDGGVFHMSSDEEVSSGPGGLVLNGNFNPNVRALSRPFNSSAGKTIEMNMSTPTRAATNFRVVVGEGPSMNMSTSVDKATFFASSLFQNSPSPDELPDPLLL